MMGWEDEEGRRTRKAPYSELGTSGQRGQPCLCIIHMEAIARSQDKAAREVTCKGASQSNDKDASSIRDGAGFGA